jgi:hypothetical protein
MSLSLLQWCFVIVALLAVGRTVHKARMRAIPRVWAAVWSFAWLGLGVVASLPKTTDLLAARFGVSRGADLVVYVAVGALLWMVFHLVVKVEGVQWQLTQFVRADALRDVPSSQDRS